MILGFVIAETLILKWIGASLMLMAMCIAPIAHVLGLLLGVLAINRPNDNKRYGWLGILLNAGLIAFGLVVTVNVVSRLKFPFH